MIEQVLRGCRVLVVEDEYLLADDLSVALSSAGAEVLGPVPSVDEAAERITAEPRIDVAVLDVNLRGDMVFPVADALIERGVPFAFATGYDCEALPDRFAAVPRVEKPFKAHRVAAILAPLIASGGEQPLNN
ncbi:response regulator [Sphingomonas sp. H39-1-10]|uniref:response regulator n=1 Tax=Sphingomonas pollutisoli TaxID=3030829 RepID=UPI0023B9EBD4|nr:response regulator [Sphingomonas pollutisoli]MDF0488432.1 response regulator [Sphingomonas pollutisoli]